MFLKKRHPLKTIAKLLADHERYAERGREFYAKAGQKLDKALALQAPLGEPIPMPDGRRVVIRDQYADSNVAFTRSAAPRYKVDPYRADRIVVVKTRAVGKTTAAAVVATSGRKPARALPAGFVDCTVDFPKDDVPVRVLTRDGITGTAAYCSEAGQWYVCKKGHPTHRLLWTEVFGPRSEIVAWGPLEGN